MNKPALSLTVPLRDGSRLEVGMTLVGDPAFPTPNEREIRRIPLVTEWPEIIAALTHMKFTITKVSE